MKKEKIKEIKKKIFIFILFLISSFLLSLITYPLIFKYPEISSLSYIFGNIYMVIYLYFLFIFSIFYLIFEFLCYFLNKKKAIMFFTLITFFSVLSLLWSIDMIDEPASFWIYLFIITSLSLVPLLSFYKLIKNVKIKIIVLIIFIIIFIIIHLIFPGYGKKILEHNIREGHLCDCDSSEVTCSMLTLNEYFPYYGCKVIKFACIENEKRKQEITGDLSPCGFGGCSDNLICYYLCPSLHIPEWHGPLKNK